MNDFVQHATDEKRVWPWAKVIADPQFRALAVPVADWIRRAREKRRSPIDLLLLQTELAKQILHSQDQRREFEMREHGEAAQDPRMRDDLQTCIAMAKRSIRIVMDVADGIGWRALNYDRLAIRQLAGKPQTGALTLETAVQEVAAAIHHAEKTGNVVVLNDLTNFLRFGDFTSIGADGVLVAEVKAGGGSARSGKAKRQRKRLDDKLDFLNSGVGKAPDGSAAILLRTKASARSHTTEVGQLVEDSEKSGSAYARLSDSLAVEVFRPVLLAEAGKEPKFNNPFLQSPLCFAYATFKLFDAWSPNIAPFSIFPFPPNQCADLLVGSIWIVSYVNFDNIIRCFRRRGLLATLPTQSETAALAGLRPGEFVYHELDAPVTVEGPKGGVRFSVGTFGRIYAEFLDEESLADQMEEVVGGVNEELSLFVGFRNEADIWD